MEAMHIVPKSRLFGDESPRFFAHKFLCVWLISLCVWLMARSKMMMDILYAFMRAILVEELKSKKVVKVAAGGAHTACVTGKHLREAHGCVVYWSLLNVIGVRVCTHVGVWIFRQIGKDISHIWTHNYACTRAPWGKILHWRFYVYTIPSQCRWRRSIHVWTWAQWTTRTRSLTHHHSFFLIDFQINLWLTTHLFSDSSTCVLPLTPP